VRLWDVASGRLLLTLGANNILPDVRFSPDGKQIAFCTVPAFGSPGVVEIWQLENGRGIQTLHGLEAPVEQVHYSPDERFIAALSHDWQVGVWELPIGNLRHILDVEPGITADNAALAFSADGSQLAFSAGDQAKLWDITTGQVVKYWQLRPGLGDHLAFHSSGNLLSVRFEEDEESPPVAGVPAGQHPRVVRIRDLLSANPEKPIKEIKAFPFGVPQSLMTRDGAHFVLEGPVGPGRNDWSIRAYDGPTGEERWALNGMPSGHSGYLKCDPAGELLALRLSQSNGVLVKMADRQVVRALADDPTAWPTALGPRGDYQVARVDSPRFGYQLCRGSNSAPLVILGLDVESYAVVVQFNAKGTRLAWGNADGTVSICDLRQVQTRLTQLGFGW
jgi:WD40 repeat protein